VVLFRITDAMTRRRWTAEDQITAEVAAACGVGTREIGRVLGRAENVVRGRIHVVAREKQREASSRWREAKIGKVPEDSTCRAKCAASYPERLAAIGRLIALEPYTNSKTPILHRCLEHGEKHRCSPNNALRGWGLRCCNRAAAQSSRDRKKAEAAAKYHGKLAAIGRLIALEPYIDCKTPILHRCKKHGEVHLCRPSSALAGQGLWCCRIAASQAMAAQSNAATAANYSGRLAAIGKLIALDPYIDSETPILHRCVKHGEEHQCKPAEALRGRGLRCCRLAAPREHGDSSIAKAAARYDEKLAAIGRFLRMEAYIDSKTPILHHCVKHGSRFKAPPTQLLSGHGLSCCRMASVHATAKRKNAKAAANYSERLAAVGKLVALEPYIDSKTPIRHRCIEHGEEHLARPRDTLSGYGLQCCSLAAPRQNTVSSVIFNPSESQLLAPCQFYVYSVKGDYKLAKPGVSKDHESRARRDKQLYGDLHAVWDLPTRRDALLIEGAILRDPSIPRPSGLAYVELGQGFTEIRRIAPAALVAHAQCLIDSLADHAGPWQQWALDNVPTLRRAERTALRRQIA